MYGFVVYISDWIVHHLKHGMYFNTIQIRADNTQWLFFQWKSFVIIWMKYPAYRNTHCRINISNHVHKLDQGYMLTDTVNNFKITFYIPFIDLMMKTLILFISFLVRHNCASKHDYIRITIPLIYQLLFDTSQNSRFSKTN